MVKFDLAKVACTSTDGVTCTSTGTVSRNGDTRGVVSMVATF